MLQISPDGHEVLDRLPAGPGRHLLGITGSPGAGKSRLAEAIAGRAPTAVHVPMDGFHLADVELERRRLRERKGAPETFDAWGYAALLARLRARPDHVVMAPAFDRQALEQPIAGAIPVPPAAELVVTEGNYLLLDSEPWRAVRDQLDEVWHVVTAEPQRVTRLVERHVASGKTPLQARRWVDRVDRANGVPIEAAAHRADLVLDLTAWRGTLP